MEEIFNSDGSKRVKPRENLIGKKFGRLTVLKRTDDYISKKGAHLVRWLCQCDCGRRTEVIGGDLKRGKVLSCGCYKNEEVSKRCFDNLTGKHFGRLLVIKRVDDYIDPHENHQTKYLCQCDCGNFVEATRSSLKSGNTQSCGCYKNEVTSERNFKDLTGQKFGRLLVTKRVDDYVSPKGEHKPRYLCQCDCGNFVEITGRDLKNERTQSCGCYKSEITSKKFFKHGDASENAEYHRIHRIWGHMKDRCSNPKCEYYKDYGGRGIKVCDEWSNSETGYLAFKTWALQNGYQDNLSIDRIDNNKGYCPENCHWCSMKIQANNKRSNNYIEYEGEIKSLKMWSETLNINYGTLQSRLDRGWSVEDAFTKSVKKNQKKNKKQKEK